MRIHLRRTPTALVASVSILVLAGFTVRPSHAVTQLTTQLVASGLARPLYVTAPPGDDRIFIVEQRIGSIGRVRIVKNGALLAKPFVSVSPVATGSEQGLLGLAFPPDYATSGRFYLHYNNAAGTTILARYTVSAFADTANPTGQIIFTLGQPFTNHNGGWIAFGTDGYLWMALGDGGSAGDPGDRAQNIDNQLGKILRFDVSGAGAVAPAPDNPFIGAIPGNDNVWCYGLRNPWRCSFDRLTGDLIIADVGQNVWEEVNWAPASSGPAKGYNWGWRCYEANTFYDSSTTIPCGSCIAPSCNLKFPAYAYDHSLGRCSVTGGYVYRGCKIPDLQGTYFFADYCGNQIYSGKFSGGVLTGVTTRTTELDPAGTPTLTSIVSFGEDAQGEMYICEQGGEVWRIVPRVAGVAEADMPTIQVSTALGTLGSTTPGNAITPGITPFADAGSRIVGVGFLRTAQIRACPSSDPNCLYTHTRLGTWDIDLDACVDAGTETLTRVLRFTNRAAGDAPLSFVDVVAPWLRGDDDEASAHDPYGGEPGPNASLLLVTFDAESPDLWVSHLAQADHVAFSFDVDDYTELTARVAADQPLTNQAAAGPGRVAMATRADAGDVPPGEVVEITLTNRLQPDPPVGVEPEIESLPGLSLRAVGPLPFRESLRLAFALPAEGAVQLEVFDVRGRRVRRLNAGTLPAGRHEVVWDGRDDRGEALGSGMYLVRLETPAGERAVRVVRVQ